MPQYLIEKRDFLKGLSQSEELGGFFRDMQGINVYSQSGIGVLMNADGQTTVYSESSATPLQSMVTQLIPYSNPTSTQNILALSSNRGIGIRLTGADAETTPNVITFTTADNKSDKRGAALYHLGSQSSNNIGIFYSKDTDIGVYDVTKSFTSETQWNGDFMSTVPAGASTISSATFRAMYHHKRHDILYWNSGSAGNQVDKFDANTGVNGTLSENALDLPVEWEIRDFGQLRDYLAILAIHPRSGGSDDANIQFRSKIFFWDGISDSWTYETPLIHDQIVRLVNAEEGLFGIGKGDGVSYYRLELEQAVRLFNYPKAGLDITAGRRDGNNLANYGAVTSVGNQLFFMGLDGGNAHIFSAGNRFGVAPDRVINKTFYLKSVTGTGVVYLGDLAIVSPNKIYASFQDTNGASADQFRIVRFSPGVANTKDARVDTVELDSYFGGSGRLKKLNWIRFDIEELVSGDILEVYKEIDYDNTWTRLDGDSSAGAGNSIRESDFSGEGRTTIKFTRSDIFRHLRLRFNWTGGSVRIRRIVIDFNWNE